MSHKENIDVHGFFRIKIGEEKDGKVVVVSDSGWRENEIVNLGFQDYICASLGAVAGSKQISNMALGSGTAPAAAHTSLDGEHTNVNRKTTSNSVVSSKTLQCTAAWQSADHPGGTLTLSNIGLFNTNAITTGTLACGNTFDSSQWQANQAVSATYQLRFGTTSALA